MDYTHGRSRGRPYSRCLPCIVLCGMMAMVAVVVIGLITYIDYRGDLVRWPWGDYRVQKEYPPSGYPGAPDLDEQVAMGSGNVREELVVQEGQLHVRSDIFSRRHAKREDGEAAELAAAGEKPTPPFKIPPIKLPKLPVPTEIIDLPTEIPTHIPDIISAIPLPTDAVDVLPTDPGDIIGDLPGIPSTISIPPLPTITIPPIPTIPPLPTITVPVPVPTTTSPPLLLPDLTKIPEQILGTLHGVIDKLSADPDTPGFSRYILKLIKKLIDRLGGGGGKKPKPTTSLPTSVVPTVTVTTLTTVTTSLPSNSWLPPWPTGGPPPVGSLPPSFTPKRSFHATEKKSEAGDREPLSDEKRKQLMALVRKEVLARIEWDDPIGGLITLPLAMAAFEGIYRVAEAWKGTDDEAERERLLGLLVIVPDEDDA
ncbi:hypothetical protein Daus18300_000120 [Diaporthe australafricana]|uniref:Uncharacterized protein n=1 Tax=Diaporthe australafricana TaxID=127596 RepID=A0ABR3Y6T5_9PEZI